MHSEGGQSLFEIIMALAIATLIIVAIVALAATSIRNTTFSKNKTLATRYSQEAVEWLRGERDADWETFFDIRAANPLYCLKSLTWSDASIGACLDGQEIANTAFKREVSFTRTTVTVGGLPKDVVGAEIKVYWIDPQGIHETRTVTDFTDWRQAF